jgi:hypothetical protein
MVSDMDVETLSELLQTLQLKLGEVNRMSGDTPVSIVFATQLKPLVAVRPSFDANGVVEYVELVFG